MMEWGNDFFLDEIPSLTSLMQRNCQPMAREHSKYQRRWRASTSNMAQDLHEMSATEDLFDMRAVPSASEEANEKRIIWKIESTNALV